MQPYCVAAPVVRNTSTQKDFFLVAALHVRLFADDPARLTADDLVHWLTFHRYAGVDRVWVYDCAIVDGERFGDVPAIAAARESGFLEYVDWGGVARANVDGETGRRRRKHILAVQIPAFEDAQRRIAGTARWLALADVDEYFYVADDAEPGFLARAVRRKSRASRRGRPVRVSQLLFRNVIAEGPRDAARGPMLAQQVPRLRDAAHNRSETATKQIVRLDAVARHNLHRSDVSRGETLPLPRASGAFLKHYHAGRAAGFAGSWADLDVADRAALLSRTRPDACPACDAVARACLGRDPTPPPADVEPPNLLLVGAALLLTYRSLAALLRRRAASKGGGASPRRAARARWR